MDKPKNINNSKFNRTDKAKKPRRSIALSQNFINNRGVISTIISHVDFSRTDLLIEIGPELSKKLEYKYPDKLENDIRKYLAGLKPKT